MLRNLVRPFVAVLLAASVSAAQSEVSLKPVLRKGDEFAYSLGMAVDVSQQMGEGQPEQVTPLRVSARLRMKVLEVTPAGAAKLEGTFEEAMVQAPIGDQQVGFEWPAAALPDNAPAVARLGETLEKAILSIDVDDAGRATVTSGLEKFVQAASKLDYPDDRFMGFFTNEKLSNAITPIFELDGAWKAPRVVGRGWQSTDLIPMPPAGAIEITTDYVVNEADSDTITCYGQYSLTLKRPENPADDVATVNLGSESAGGCRIVYDRHRMLLQLRKSSVTINTDWVLGNVNIKQKQVSVMNIRLIEQ
ncbi:MAG: hypothetical protein JNK58_09285 [Phycisphaerae bacterium]|nr:hypothetical protein [Phycisphaerae bacterium]